jgi:hypothetical protein
VTSSEFASFVVGFVSGAGLAFWAVYLVLKENP